MRLIELLIPIGLSVCVSEGILGSGFRSWFKPPVFRCDENREVDLRWRCDGVIDCKDKTDERNCEYQDCIPDDTTRFSCKHNNRCILQEFVCDGTEDCTDKSDEVDCSPSIYCPPEFFSCADNSSCYPKSFMCDGHPDCRDKSDESSENCHGTLHGYQKCKDKFSCGYGICLEDEKFVCDGKKNCPDGRDESPTTCQSHPDCKNCTQQCTRHSHGVTCGCNVGYELAEDGVTCNDIDECARGICSQNCRNSKGSFTCSCKNGFKLVNETKCENKVKATFVWYSGADSKGGQVILERDGREQKFRLPKSTEGTVSTVIMPSMEYDIDNEKLYLRSGNTLYITSTNNRRHYWPTFEKEFTPGSHMMDFAVEPSTGNIYFGSFKGFTINVCDPSGLCIPYTARRPHIVSGIRIVRLSNQTRVFWKEGMQIMSGSLDGQEIRTVFKVMNGEWLRYYVVDEQSEKMYVVQSHLLEVDLATQKTRRLTSLNFGNSSMFWNMAVHDDRILVQHVLTKSLYESRGSHYSNQILQIDRQTGDHLGLLDIAPQQQLHSVLRKSPRAVRNPCAENECSHVCVPSSGPTAFTCLCPPGMHLDENNDNRCVPQEGEEQVYFVNGTHVYVYVFEQDELYLNQDFELDSTPLAIATSLDMNLLYSTQHEIYEVRKDGSLKEYDVPGVRAMVVDPVDNVLYAANEYELLAVNLKTSEVALIRDGEDIKHMDIDPANRILYVETKDSDLYTFEIGTWERLNPVKLASSSGHEERTWSFNPLLRNIQPDVALVLEGGQCELVDYLPRGFDCHRQAFTHHHVDHHNDAPRLLARAGRPLAPLKGAACDTTKCAFCVSANGSSGKKPLEPVCICPYGHELGADGVSCSKTCGSQMLRCKSNEKQCIHQSRRCDGFKDCSDGSDELHCFEHDCREMFKCHVTGTCVPQKFVCDGKPDCSDHSDEDHCPARNCTASEFKCEDGKCLSVTKRCDGTSDCFHGDDELNCPKTECKKNEFDCGNNKCISQEWLCDSQKDCPNGEDEANCPALVEKYRKLPKHDCDSKWIFCCKSGEQLPINMKCNGVVECSDSSDEDNCTTVCKAPRFLCNSGACLQESEVCDGIPHCPNAADEHNCKGKCAKKGLFECRADGTCIPEGKLCDGNKDCSDGADEVTSRCPVTPETPVNITCSADEFKCGDGKCIPAFQVCDGQKQCADGSDENDFCGKVDCTAAGCSHGCYAKGPREVKCKCPKGYYLMYDGQTCDDVDECKMDPNICSQFCNNLKGSYECVCAPGFRVNANGNCRVESGESILIIVEDGRVETIHENKDRDMLLNLPASHIESIDYDVSKGLVYVSDTDNNQIHRIPLNAFNGKYKHEIYDQLKPGALAFDWVARNLYFADHRPSIHVCNVMVKGFCKILTEVNIKPVADAPDPAITSIALVPDAGIMFYAEASTGFIFRQNMDGTDRSIFPWAAGERRPLSLTVDHVHRNLIWIDAQSGKIESSNLKGENIRTIADHLSSVRAFTLFEDYLYFAEPSSEHWMTIHKQTGKIRSTKRSPLGRVSLAKLMHQVNQPAEVNRCFSSGCQQMCLLKPHGFTCACTDGQELSADNKTCVQATIDNKNVFDEKHLEKLKRECSCENGGKCTKLKQWTEKYHCVCLPGYHGDRCESGPTSSLVLTVFLICTFFIVFAGAGVYLMTLAAKKQLFRREARASGVADRLTLIEKDADDEI